MTPGVIAGAFCADAGRARLARAHGGPAPLSCGELVLSASGAVAQRDGRICALHGVVDNLDAVAAELASAETEPAAVLLAAWSAWGDELAARLRGEFVVVASDGERLLAVRDRLGARALYWARTGRGLCFATEVAPLRALVASSPGPDRAALARWLSSRPLSGDETLFEGVRRLPAAHALTARCGAARVWRWWRPAFREPLDEPRPELARRVRACLAGALADVREPGRPGALLLSGGLDSAALAALAPAGSVRAYTAGFPGFQWTDETDLVDTLVARLGLSGARVNAGGEGLLAGGLRHIERWGLPPAGWSDFWERPLIGAAAAGGAGPLLAGDGGDEVFGARLGLLADLLRRGRALAAWRAVRRVPGAAEAPPRRELLRFLAAHGLRDALPPPLARLASGIDPAAAAPRWLRAPARAVVEASDAAEPWRGLDGPAWWKVAAWSITEQVEHLGALDHIRRRAAWSGLEARSPLLAPDVVELALAIPPQLTFDPLLSRPLLREALAGALPDAVRLRPEKAIFNRMVGANLLADHAGIEALLERMRPELAEVADPAGVRRLLDAGPEGHPEHQFMWAQQLLRLVTAECWLRELDTPGTARALLAEGRFSDPGLATEPLA